MSTLPMLGKAARTKGLASYSRSNLVLANAGNLVHSLYVFHLSETGHIETVIIGAGQAGLATAYHLQRLGRECVVLDAEARIGDNWRHQWDSLRLFSPAWADSLPGLRNPSPRLSFPTKDEFADHLQTYATQLALPVRLGTGVDRVTAEERVPQIGQRWYNGDLVAFGLVSLGRLLIHQGRAAEGLAMLDEAMTCLTTGEVSPIWAGHIYCTMIEGCQEISDFRRMGEWTEALTRWCEPQQGLVPFTGQCAVHRGQLMRTRLVS